jgi:hypothetical protein
MTNNSIHSSTESPHSDNATSVIHNHGGKRPYTPPALTHYGAVTEITQKNPLSFLQDEIIAETSP